MPVCTKTVFLLVLESSHVAKAHIITVSLSGELTSVALAADVSFVSILEAGDRATVFTLARYVFFSTYISARDWHQDLVLCTVLGHSEYIICW